jgi:predicted TIM-barrel fold metal-dependent hydrolase
MVVAMKIIDPHVHLFDIKQGDYFWLKPDNEPFWPDKRLIHQNFELNDLALPENIELAGIVHIEAGFNNKQPWQEIIWLERLWHEKQYTTALKTIAFIDITLSTDEFNAQIEQLKKFKSVVGCRYILDDNAGRLLRDHQVIRNLEVLYEIDWLFELHVTLSDQQTLHHIVNFCAEVKTPKMVINHCGLPPSMSDFSQWHNWRHQIEQLAQFDHLAIKCSGWEMTNRNYNFDEVTSCITQVIKSFGAERTMLASNFPLTLFSQSYQSVWSAYIHLLGLPQETLTQICQSTAKTWYRF